MKCIRGDGRTNGQRQCNPWQLAGELGTQPNIARLLLLWHSCAAAACLPATIVIGSMTPPRWTELDRICQGSAILHSSFVRPSIHPSIESSDGQHKQVMEDVIEHSSYTVVCAIVSFMRKEKQRAVWRRVGGGNVHQLIYSRMHNVNKAKWASLV